MTGFPEHTTVVIRSVGERTTENCRAIFEERFYADSIHVVSATPFAETVRQSIHRAVSSKKRWAIMVDADCLVDLSALNKLIHELSHARNNVFGLQGKVWDKFFGGPRNAGVHVYRTSLLQQSVELGFASGLDKEIRPETALKDQMERAGFPWLKVPTVCALHDFEQSYVDIYRKCFYQARKHIEHVGFLAEYWRQMSANDADFKVALAGLLDGLASYDNHLQDARQYPGSIHEIQSLKGIVEEEKPSHDSSKFLLSQQVKEQLSHLSPSPLYDKIVKLHGPQPPLNSRLAKKFDSFCAKNGKFASTVGTFLEFLIEGLRYLQYLILRK